MTVLDLSIYEYVIWIFPLAKTFGQNASWTWMQRVLAQLIEMGIMYNSCMFAVLAEFFFCRQRLGRCFHLMYSIENYKPEIHIHPGILFEIRLNA
jgi:hypothetical protein